MGAAVATVAVKMNRERSFFIVVYEFIGFDILDSLIY